MNEHTAKRLIIQAATEGEMVQAEAPHFFASTPKHKMLAFSSKGGMLEPMFELKEIMADLDISIINLGLAVLVTYKVS